MVADLERDSLRRVIRHGLIGERGQIIPRYILNPIGDRCVVHSAVRHGIP